MHEMNQISIVGNSMILATALAVCYSSFVYKHSSQTCNRMARLTCALGLATYCLIFAYGVQDWIYRTPHYAFPVHLHSVVTISSVVYGWVLSFSSCFSAGTLTVVDPSV